MSYGWLVVIIPVLVAIDGPPSPQQQEVEMMDRLINNHPNIVAVIVVAVMVAVFLTMALLFPVTGNAQAQATDRWFAEGNTLPEFETYFCVQNPGDRQATVLFTFYLEDGSLVVRQIEVSPTSRFTVRLADIVPAGHSGVSAHVYSTSDVVVERPMYFNYRYKWTGGSTSSGQTNLRNLFFFAEGTTRNNQTDGQFETWLCLQNPHVAPAYVVVTYATSTGDIVKAHWVDSHSRLTIDAAQDIGLDRDCGIVVTSSLPIACERAMYFNYHGTVQDGSSVVGASAPANKWYFAEGTTRPGFDEWLTILNPSDRQAQATVRYLVAGGGGLNPQVTFIPPRSRKTLFVNNEAGVGLDLSAVVESDVPVVAERSLYADTPTCYGGDSSMGTSPANTWEFAEGTTRSGFTTYITVMNPNPEPVTANVLYQFADGTQLPQTITLPASSRATIDIAGVVGHDHDVSVTASSRSWPVVAERPVYFFGTYRGSTVGSGVAK